VLLGEVQWDTAIRQFVPAGPAGNAPDRCARLCITHELNVLALSWAVIDFDWIALGSGPCGVDRLAARLRPCAGCCHSAKETPFQGGVVVVLVVAIAVAVIVVAVVVAAAVGGCRVVIVLSSRTPAGTLC